MIRSAKITVILFLWISLFLTDTRAADRLFSGPSPIPEVSRQIILVITPVWDSQTGVLRRFERDDTSSEWRGAGEARKVVVGKNGLAWGRGLHDIPVGGPVKKEGDGKAPAGVFRIGPLFGYAPQEELPELRMGYVRAHSGIQCVDDPISRYYNELVDITVVDDPDWNSFEHMRRHDDQYRIGAVVQHNSDPVRKGAGSCIFLHVWGGPSDPTIGCTAMQGPDMEMIAQWLDEAKSPVLVQLPAHVYNELRATWQLPDMSADL